MTNCATCSSYRPQRKEALEHGGRKTKAQEKNGGKPVGKTAEADGRENEGAGKAAKTTVKDITRAMNILLDTEKTSSTSVVLCPAMKRIIQARVFIETSHGQRFTLHPGMNMNHQGTRIFTERSMGSTLCPPPGDENHAPVLHFHENSVGLIPRCSLSSHPLSTLSTKQFGHVDCKPRKIHGANRSRFHLNIRLLIQPFLIEHIHRHRTSHVYVKPKPFAQGKKPAKCEKGPAANLPHS